MSMFDRMHRTGNLASRPYRPPSPRLTPAELVEVARLHNEHPGATNAALARLATEAVGRRVTEGQTGHFREKLRAALPVPCRPRAGAKARQSSSLGPFAKDIDDLKRIRRRARWRASR